MTDRLSEDAEVEAMRTAWSVIEPLDWPARKRVIAWLEQRGGVTGDIVSGMSKTLVAMAEQVEALESAANAKPDGEA